MEEKLLKPFLNSEGQVAQWPAKRPKQAVVLEYLASKFEANHSYTETEVNDILKEWHTFEDWALLRRELFDKGYFDRELDGSDYQLAHPADLLHLQ
jgi:hypothetical protein